MNSTDTTSANQGYNNNNGRRVLIVEDQLLVAEFLQLHCYSMQLQVVKCCAGFVDGLASIREHQPDLVLLDISLPDGDGLELARIIMKELPKVRLLAISSHQDPWTMLQVQRIGLHGFVDKHKQSPRILSEAICTVLSGQIYFTPVVMQSSALIRMDPNSFIRVLSDYEMRILSMIGESKTDNELAVILGISPATVQSRRRDIMQKLNVHSTPKLIHFAIVNGLTRAEQIGRKPQF